MRIAEGCSGFGRGITPKERIGILRYNDTSQEDPATKAHEYGTTCADEPYENLKPILPWRIGKPSNERKESICEARPTYWHLANPFHLAEEYNTFEVGFSPETNRPPWRNNSRWQMGKHPLWLNFSNPTIVNFHTKFNETDWEIKPDLAVISESNANTAESWIYLMITATQFPFSGERRINRFVPAAHPVNFNFHSTLQERRPNHLT